MAAQNTAGDELAMRRKRLRFRAWHRGTREMDLLLGPFCDARIESFALDELDRLEAVLEENDVDLFRWAIGQAAPPTPQIGEFLAAVTEFHKTRASK